MQREYDFGEDVEYLTAADLKEIADIVQGHVETQGHRAEVELFPAILRKLADGMCHDDYIKGDGNTTWYSHG